MKKLFGLIILAATLFTACNKNRVEVALLGDNSFVESTATLTILLSEASSNEVTIGLSYLERDLGTSKALPGGSLEYDNPIFIAPGSTSAQLRVKVKDMEGLSDGNYCATFTISYAGGATISRTNTATIYLKIGGGTPHYDLQLMSSWSVRQTSAPYYDEALGDKPVINLAATVPGIKYFWVEANTDADLEEYYHGTVEGLLDNFSQNLSSQIAGGARVGDLLWSSSEAAQMYAIYWGAGQTNFYIMEFDATGKATGRYGKTPMDLFDYDTYFGGLTLTDKSDEWTVTYAGVQEHEFDEGPSDCEFFTVAGTGSTPFSFILEKAGLIDKAETLRSYMLNDFLDFYATDVICGYTASDIYNTAPGTYCSLYEAVKGDFEAYLIAYDPETCYPTGAYAKCTFTDTEGADPAPSGAPMIFKARKNAPRTIKLLKSTR
ncbi:MAG: hypothetical protein IKP46_03175 [Bacteroidales bacterium]|nr:hypothetical protein [Bacteroidales bacterium]